jgi:NCAIR mutase (PurE)-related protein
VDEATLQPLIDDVRSGTLDPDVAVARLRRLPFVEVGDALVDHHRALRQGMPEAVYGRGKSVEQCVAIVGELLTNGAGPVLLTRRRLSADAFAAFGPGEPAAAQFSGADRVHRASKVLVASNGTSDRPIVDNAFARHLRLRPRPARRHQRFRASSPAAAWADHGRWRSGRCGRDEGALASVIGGLTSRRLSPSRQGWLRGRPRWDPALLAMHASCASGITVVRMTMGLSSVRDRQNDSDPNRLVPLLRQYPGRRGDSGVGHAGAGPMVIADSSAASTSVATLTPGSREGAGAPLHKLTLWFCRQADRGPGEDDHNAIAATGRSANDDAADC